MGPLISASTLVPKTDWHLALVYSACMFFTAALGWLFINPTKVIVYSREDRQRLREEGVLN